MLAMTQSPEAAFRGYVLDGVPRTQAEAQVLLLDGEDNTSAQPARYVVELQLSTDDALHRRLHRRTTQTEYE